MWIWFATPIALVALYDLVQRRHAILRNFPIVGHFRYWLEALGPELRQYIVTNNDEEKPFSRDQRRWVYASSKKENNYFGFGSDNDFEARSSYVIVKHRVFADIAAEAEARIVREPYAIPCAKVLGAPRQREKAFRPTSIVNVSAMSYGSLSARAVEAIDRGCALAGCLHNTGEGSVSDHHLHGADLVWQIGTGYFGCRDESGSFDIRRFSDRVRAHPSIRAIEIKLSQGAKPGLGGILPAAKITPEIARVRGIPMGRDCISPARHTAFRSTDEMLDFVERLAEESGLPVGIKSAVGEEHFWRELAHLMEPGTRGVDFVAVDGGEGGTGAAPLVFADHVALTFRNAFARVFATFAERGLDEKLVFIGSGKLGFPESALLALGMGCDMINVAREPMLAVGCIQAQRCHTGHCPTGVATQNRWLVRGLDPASKAPRLANYLLVLRKELLRLSLACGVVHPSLVSLDHFELFEGGAPLGSVRERLGYDADWGIPSDALRHEVERLMLEAV